MHGSHPLRDDQRDDEARSVQTIVAPSAHAGLIRALQASFARKPVLPKEWQRLLDKLH